MQKQFVTKVRFQKEHPDALAIYCSDGRFTEAVEQLLAALGHARLDTLTTPGGAALFNARSAGFADWDSLSRAATFLIRGHHIEHVVLLAHAGCGHYRARAIGKSDDEIAHEQIADLRTAAEVLRNAHPSLDVRLYFARPHDGTVAFDEIATT